MATQEFLVAIAEPVSRQQYIHTYKLTNDSLYAAISGGLPSDKILKELAYLCKTELPKEIVDFIKKETSNYGKANLVLRHGKMKIESSKYESLEFLINDECIRNCLVKNDRGVVEISTEDSDLQNNSNPFNNQTEQPETNIDKDSKEFNEIIDKKLEEIADINYRKYGLLKKMIMGGASQEKIDKFTEYLKGKHVTSQTNQSGDKQENIKNDEQDILKKKVVFSVEIIGTKLETVKKRCIKLKSTLLSEYDFRNDAGNPDIKIDLKPTTILRSYQEKALSKMFGDNRARSGIIVLPCGAGKTLVGVTAACTVRKRCIVFTTCGVAVDQWKNHFIGYTTLEEKKVCRFTGSTKDPYLNTEVFITTYNIIGYGGKRSYETEKTLDWIKNQEWGLIVLDEVHTIPAMTFRRVLQVIHGHCMLGLTATLVREDDKISDLSFLVGPKLYEADWMELQNKGFIARVQCVHVRCPMDPDFFKAYCAADGSLQLLLSIMNPEKFRRCQFLINYHEKRGDKILVFSDNLFALRVYAKKLNKFYLEGDTSHEERTKVMDNFKKNPAVNTIFVSKMADVALDLPEANVLIQISSQGASRRQEAQRLGRITRAKKDMQPDETNAFFYTLISTDTQEEVFCVRRQSFLKDQGYAFKLINAIMGMENEDLMYKTSSERKELLEIVLRAKKEDCIEENEARALAKKKVQTANKGNDIRDSISKKRKEYFNSSGVSESASKKAKIN